MKSVINEVSARDKFPKLMRGITSGNIVLFSSLKCGVIVNSSRTGMGHLGDYSETWDMGSFKDYNGTVTLSND